MKLFLVEERKRLGLKAKEVAQFVGVTIPTQSNYENGKRSPDTKYLHKLSELGFDLNYVVTGRRKADKISEIEQELIELFSRVTVDMQEFIITGLRAVKSNTFEIACERFELVAEDIEDVKELKCAKESSRSKILKINR